MRKLILATLAATTAAVAVPAAAQDAGPFTGPRAGVIPGYDALRPGDTLYRDVPVEFPPIPSFSPEYFSVVRGKDPSKHKQFRKGIEQLDQEGVVQVLRSDKRGEQAPVFAAVGPMQFEVAAHRMATEIGAAIMMESLPYQVARVVEPEDAEFMSKQVSCEVLTRSDGVMLVLFSTPWRLEGFQRDNPSIKLRSLVAAAES